MPQLTRRRDPDANLETWQVYYGDVQVGTIGRRAGVPVTVDQWAWRLGFYPGTKPGEDLGGTAATFDQARDDFGKAWPGFLAKRTEADFQAWRRNRAWTAWKYAMRERAAGCRPRCRSCGRGASAAKRSERRARSTSTTGTWR